MKRSAILLLAFMVASCAKEPPKDPLLARAESGDPQAQIQWAQTLARDDAQLDEALRWHRRAASTDEPNARAALAAFLQDKRLAPERFEESIQLLDTLASEGDADSALALSRLHGEGEKLPRDAAKEQAYLLRAAELGSAPARLRLATSRWEAASGQLDKESRRLLKSELYELGRQGEARAYGLLGRILDSEGDTVEADKWHFEAAKAGEPFSMYRTGLAYHRYLRSPSYGPLGFDFLQQAEAAGVEKALGPLGLAYVRGNGVVQDERRGSDLLRIAAWRGDPDALETLALVVATQKRWSLRDAIEVAAMADRFKNLARNERFSLQSRSAIRGRALELLGQRRSAVISDAAEAYRPGGVATFQIPDTESLWERYADDAAFARQALEATGSEGAETRFQMGVKCLSPENRYNDPIEAIAWLADAMGNGHADAGLELFNLFKADPAASPLGAQQALSALETSAERGNAEAALAMARERQSGELAPADPSQVVRFALLADAAGLPEGLLLAKETILAHPDHAFDVESSRRALDALADDGDPRRRFDRALRVLAETNGSDISRYRPNAWGIVSSIGRSLEHNAKDVLRVRSNEGWKEIAYAATRDELPAEAWPAMEAIAALADEGYTPAAEIAAAWRFFGYFLPQDRAAAMATYESLARDERSIDALLIVGYSATRGFQRARDLPGGARLIRRAYDLGSKEARYFFAEKPLDKLAGPFDLIDLIYRASELEDTAAMLKVADYFRLDNTLDKETRDAEYAAWLTLAARKDDIKALTRIGLAYVHGEGVEKNPARGMRYLERCAELGSAEAQYVFGQLLISGAGVEPDHARGIGQLESAAALGDLQAQSFLAAARRAFPGRALGEIDREPLIHIALASLTHRDHFPVAPQVVAGGRLRAVVGVARDKPTFEIDGRAHAGDRSQPAVFLATAGFHPAIIDVTAIQVDAPFVFLKNGLVYTGRKPAISFHAKADADVDGVYCALLVENVEAGTSYEWKQIGELRKGKERRIRFAMESAFVEPEDVAIAFFAGGAEILSDVRKQPNHFAASELTEFTRFRHEYLSENREATLDAALHKSIAAHIGGLAQLFAPGDHALIDVTELGYISRIEIAASGPPPKALEALLAATSRIVFLPALREGKAVPAKARIELTD